MTGRRRTERLPRVSVDAMAHATEPEQRANDQAINKSS